MITAADTMAIKYFDTLEYVKESEKRGANSDLAEYQAKQMETALETAVQYVTKDQKDFVKKTDSQNFATKDDISRLENSTKNDSSRLEKRIDRLENHVECSFHKSRYDTLKFVVWTGVGVAVSVIVSVVGSLVGLLGHGLFHWF